MDRQVIYTTKEGNKQTYEVYNENYHGFNKKLKELEDSGCVIEIISVPKDCKYCNGEGYHWVDIWNKELKKEKR
jgi:hypothetical protein